MLVLLKISSYDISTGILNHVYLLCQHVQLEVPKELISSKQLDELRLQREPSFISVSQDAGSSKVYDKETGITQRRLSNGIPVNYKVYSSEMFQVTDLIMVCKL